MRSLRARLLLAVALAVLALAWTYLWVIPGVVYVTEDVVFERVVARALERNVARHAVGGALDTNPDWLQVHLGFEGLDPRLRGRVESLGPGIHEVNDLSGTDGVDRELFLGVDSVERDGLSVPLIVVADVTPFEAYERIPAPFFVGVIAVGLGLAAGLAVLGLLLTLRLFGALGRLRALVSAEASSDGFLRAGVEEFGKDEVGHLARLLVESSDRVADAMQRERDFTRDASHELRTPLTVARGAVELLEQHLDRELPPDEARLAQLLQRLRIAHRDMEGIVRVFLWLARESVDGEEFPRIDVAASLLEVRGDFELMARSRGTSLACEVVVVGACQVAAPPEVVAAVIRNLLQNALRHARGGTVTVAVQDGALVCRNPMESDDEVEQGFGFGLVLVGRLCERFGWRLQVGPQDGDFVARIDFLAE